MPRDMCSASHAPQCSSRQQTWLFSQYESISDEEWGTNDSLRSHSVSFARIRSKEHFTSVNLLVREIFLPVRTNTLPSSDRILRHRLFVLRASIKLS